MDPVLKLNITSLVKGKIHDKGIPRNWKCMTNDRAAQSFKDGCQFYDMEEDGIFTELKVPHPSNCRPYQQCPKYAYSYS